MNEIYTKYIMKTIHPIFSTPNKPDSFCNFYTTVFRVKRLNNQTRNMRLFNRLTRKTLIWIICNVKPCNITSRSLIIAWLSESNKTTAQNWSVQYLGVLFHSSLLLHIFWYINHKKIKGKECIHVARKYYLKKGLMISKV